MGEKAQKCHYDNKLEREINSTEIAPGFMRILKVSPGWSCKQTIFLLSTLYKIGTHTKEMVHKTAYRERRNAIWQDGLQVDDREGELKIGRKEFLQHKQIVKSSS